MTDVFISYQRAERDAVAIIAQRLVELRVNVWFDSSLKPGGAFDEEIARRLGEAKAVLTCWTPAAMASDWVRAEAAMAREDDKLVACLLEPVRLLPPFNVIHAENLTTWAGQEEDPAWLKILGRIGELCGRTGLASYAQAMRPDASLEVLRSWAASNADDPLADTAWERLRMREGESQSDRIARERAEAETASRRKRAQAKRSRELAKARGVHGGLADRTTLRRIVAAVIVIALLSVAGIGYLVDTQRRTRALDAATSPQALYAFIAAQRWHPLASEAERRLMLLDAAAWAQAHAAGTLAAIDGYVQTYSGKPPGAHLAEAYAERQAALGRIEVQRRLIRLALYAGEPDGGATTALRTAVESFQYSALLPVTGDPADPRLLAKLDERIAERVATRPEQLKATQTGAPTLDDYRRIAARLRVDALVLPAIQDVESKGRGFGADGRPLIRFETHVFSRLTQGRFDTTNPAVSSRTIAPFGGQPAEWQHLAEAFGLAPQEAYQSTSIGMFGVMGQHAMRLGFVTPAEMSRFESESEANQVEVFARFLELDSGHALQAVRSPNWTGFDPASWEAFARAYNGPGYRALHYHEKLALAYRRAADRLGIAVPANLAPIDAAAAAQPQPRAGSGPSTHGAQQARPLPTRPGDGAIDIPSLGEDDAPSWPGPMAAAACSLALLAAAAAGRRRPPATAPRGWRLLTALSALALVGATFVPLAWLPRGLSHTAGHVVAYALLAACATRAGLLPHRSLVQALGWILFVAAMECAQGLLTADRTPSPIDALASLAGAAAGVAWARAAPRSPRRIAAATAAFAVYAIAVTQTIAALRPALTAALVQAAWSRAQQSGAPRAPWPGAPGHASYALRLPGRPEPIVILDADAPAALALAPGVASAGSAPGGAGLAVLMGHRNGDFNALQYLARGERLSIAAADGATHRYAVTAIDVVPWNASGLTRTSGQELALVTCWPVDGRVSSPLRLVVRAQPVDLGI